MSDSRNSSTRDGIVRLIHAGQRLFALSIATLSVLAVCSLVVGDEPSRRVEPVQSASATNMFLDVLRLTQHVGLVEAASPQRDARTKSIIGKGLGSEGLLRKEAAVELMDAKVFARWSGVDDRLDAAEVRRALAAQAPASRTRLNPQLAEHLSLLATGYDMLDESRATAGRKLADWIVENYRPGQPLAITCVCTGNSRRSILSATMVSISAAYYGLPEIRGFSGGTKPTAFNSRTVKTLREIGLDITSLGAEAARGDAVTANLKHRIRWGLTPDDTEMESIEFSKKYDDAANPQSGFAALLVCSDAEEACPIIKGASVRVATPFLDPKAYDGTAIEAHKYAERRDDIGRLMMSVMMEARLRLIAAGKFVAVPDPGANPPSSKANIE